MLEARQAQEMARKIQAETQSTDSMEYHSKMVTVNRKVSDIERKLKNIEGELKYQRQLRHSDEITADIVGLRYAVTAGYSPEGLGSALDKLLARGIKEFGSGHTGESLSHPPLAQRMTILKKVQADWGAGRVR
ncbi:MAG: hypothetical protein KC910_12665 [Candidatus Eremiobacteraeota bacterium]|nr:hypothetical protein [Candidatus Eremiobacteraeota bacterium]